MPTLQLNLKNKRSTKIAVTWDNLVKYGVITQAKADIAQHPAKRKVIIGGKGVGKTHIPNTKAIVEYEANDYFSAFGFRKYKDSATQALSSYFSSTLAIIQAKGFDLKYDYEFRSYNFYRLQDKRNMLKNQIYRFGSLEDISGSTDGKAPANGGFFGLAIIDEPVVKQDVGNPDKIPSETAFNEDMEIMRDNLERYNDNFEDAFPNQPKPSTEEWFTMNDWGDHPLTVKAQKVFPVEKFALFNFGYSLDVLLGNIELLDELFANQDFINNLMRNNTMSVYDKTDDTLYSRMTKFALPHNHKPEKAKPLINKIRYALETGNMNALAITMGYRHEGDTDSKMLAYPADLKISHRTPEEFLKLGFKPISTHYAWDIDTSRVLTLTPTTKWVKEEIGMKNMQMVTMQTKLIGIDRQIEVPAYGSGTLGENNDIYVNLMCKVMRKHYEGMKKKPKKVTVGVDDKRKWFLHEVYKKKVYFINGYKTVAQHGIFDIGHRQDAMVTGFNSKKMYNHPKNKAVEHDIKVCTRRDLKDNRRDTAGTTNYLDRIDSLEYGFEPFTNLIWSRK